MSRDMCMHSTHHSLARSRLEHSFMCLASETTSCWTHASFARTRTRTRTQSPEASGGRLHRDACISFPHFLIHQPEVCTCCTRRSTSSIREEWGCVQDVRGGEAYLDLGKIPSGHRPSLSSAGTRRVLSPRLVWNQRWN